MNQKKPTWKVGHPAVLLSSSILILSCSAENTRTIHTVPPVFTGDITLTIGHNLVEVADLAGAVQNEYTGKFVVYMENSPYFSECRLTGSKQPGTFAAFWESLLGNITVKRIGLLSRKDRSLIVRDRLVPELIEHLIDNYGDEFVVGKWGGPPLSDSVFPRLLWDAGNNVLVEFEFQTEFLVGTEGDIQPENTSRFWAYRLVIAIDSVACANLNTIKSPHFSQDEQLIKQLNKLKDRNAK